MSLFSKTKKYPLNPSWTYQVKGMFWRLKYSESGKILCEVRDPEQKTAWFDALDEQTGQVLWDHLVLDEPWWIGVEDVSEDRAYLHTFRKPDMPQHAGIICVNLETGDIIWENPDVTFLFVEGTQVYASVQGFESRTYLLLNEQTGEVVDEKPVDPQIVTALRQKQNEEYQFRNYSYPSHFDEMHPAYEQLRNIVFDVVNTETLKGNLDVLQHAGVLYLSWHETTAKHSQSSPDLSQQFRAVEIASNSVLYADTINESVQTDAIDSFFVKDERLFYIKERSILSCIALASG